MTKDGKDKTTSRNSERETAIPHKARQTADSKAQGTKAGWNEKLLRFGIAQQYLQANTMDPQQPPKRKRLAVERLDQTALQDRRYHSQVDRSSRNMTSSPQRRTPKPPNDPGSKPSLRTPVSKSPRIENVMTYCLYLKFSVRKRWKLSWWYDKRSWKRNGNGRRRKRTHEVLLERTPCRTLISVSSYWTVCSTILTPLAEKNIQEVRRWMLSIAVK